MKKINFKPIIITFGLIVFQCICYWISKFIQAEPNLIGGLIDKRISFNIWFIIPYTFWYFMLFIIPYYIYQKDKKLFTKYVLINAAITVISNIIFIAYPTTVIRPEIIGTNILELLTRLVFWVDTPIMNCFPSMHCAYSMVWLLCICSMKNASNGFKVFTTLTSLTIMASTLIIKQHVFIDFVSGDIIALIVFILFYKEKKLTNKVKELLKI